MSSKKQKKCSACHKYPHTCNISDKGWSCKCIRRDCCLCPRGPVPPPKEIWPRVCPCGKAECITKWNEEHKNARFDDASTFVYHCECHNISLSEMGYTCDCGQWVCLACIETKELAACPSGQGEEYGQSDDKLCRACYLAWLQTEVKPTIAKKLTALLHLDKFVNEELSSDNESNWREVE